MRLASDVLCTGRMRSLWLLGLMFSTATAWAAPSIHARNGESVRLRLGHERQSGIGLRPGRARDWCLELASTEADLAEVVDVTGGTSGAHWQVSVADHALRFDTARFAADHAYRVELRRGLRTVGVALVYLYPPKAAAQERVEFGDDARPGEKTDEEMATLPKPTL
jgi:hypothetical protein